MVEVESRPGGGPVEAAGVHNTTILTFGTGIQLKHAGSGLSKPLPNVPLLVVRLLWRS